MAYYNLRRTSDHKVFTAHRTDDQAAFFYLAMLVGEALTFDGGGPAPYLFGKQRFSKKPIATQSRFIRRPRRNRARATFRALAD